MGEEGAKRTRVAPPGWDAKAGGGRTSIQRYIRARWVQKLLGDTGGFKEGRVREEREGIGEELVEIHSRYRDGAGPPDPPVLTISNLVSTREVKRSLRLEEGGWTVPPVSYKRLSWSSQAGEKFQE